MINVQDDYSMAIGSILLAHKCVFAKGDCCDYLAGRGFYGLMYAQSGHATYELHTGERFALFAGEVAFIPKGLAYLLRAEEEYVHYTVNFMLDPALCSGDGVHEMLCAHKMTVFTPAAPEMYERHFSRLADTWQAKASGYRMRAMAEVYTLLSAFVSENYVLGIDDASFRRVLPAKEYLDKHYNKESSIGMLANLCDMSETSFRREFLLVFGKTAIAYRNQLLLLHACDLLSDNLYSIGEIAIKCGFRDANYFSRFFKKHMKCAPREYRARYTEI